MNIRIETLDTPISRAEFDVLTRNEPVLHPARFPEWSGITARGMRQKIVNVLARDADSGRLLGFLPMIFMRSPLFGRHLISSPYLNVGGCFVPTELNEEIRAEIDAKLIDAAVLAADRLDVNYLELRNDREITHPALTFERRSKVLMRLALPKTSEELWDLLKAKVRNQVRKGEKAGLRAEWGRGELVRDFYHVFAATMRNVGTPVYSRTLFEEMFARLGESAEICVVRLPDGRITSSAVLLHGKGITEVPSAGTLPFANAFCANMFMYWNLLKHTTDTRGFECESPVTFDFGRSSVGCPTWRFKRQWGAAEFPIVWKYYVRRGSMDDVRPDNTSYGLAIRVWKHLPVWVTRLIGPEIVRGIP